VRERVRERESTRETEGERERDTQREGEEGASEREKERDVHALDICNVEMYRLLLSHSNLLLVVKCAVTVVILYSENPIIRTSFIEQIHLPTYYCL